MQTRTPAKSMQTMLRWVLFNLCISNSDAHGKNVSFFVGNVRERLWPSPWYDLVNVAIYPELDKSLAMAIGDEFDPDQVRGYQLIEFCHDCGIAPRLLKTELTKMLGNIRRAVQELEPPAEASSRGEKKFWNQLSDHILTRCKSYDEVVPDLLKIKI